jgi:hypothetical protein
VHSASGTNNCGEEGTHRGMHVDIPNDRTTALILTTRGEVGITCVEWTSEEWIIRVEFQHLRDSLIRESRARLLEGSPELSLILNPTSTEGGALIGVL